MRKTGLIKNIGMLVLCAALTVPAVGLTWEPMVAEASVSGNNIDTTPATSEEKATAKKEIEQFYIPYKSAIKSAGNEKKATALIKDACNVIDTQADLSKGAIDLIVKETMSQLEGLKVKAEEKEDIDTTPKTTNTNIMVGGSWVTPVAKAGNHINIVLPVVNMGRTGVKNVVVTPQISEDAAKWPFEIETSNYTQTIDRCPGTDDGGTHMDRRRELTWVLKTRKDAPSGYMPLVFDVTYEKEDKSLDTVQLTTYVNVMGTTGKAADGTTSTPRVIVTGFSTNPEVVHAGETFTLTLHMQNTSKATAVKNMLFDIQAASESTESNYVAAAFLPTAGSSTIFVDQISAGATKDISIELEARADLAQKPYVVTVEMEYEDESVNSYQNTANVSIPVRQEARVDISSIEVMPQDIEVGGETNVMFSIYNIGKTQLYNTSVTFVADSVSGGEVFLGNIAPGATGSVDAYLSGAAATMDDGTVMIQITFEDEAGEVTTIEESMTLWVNEMFVPEDMGMMDGMVDDGMMMEEPGGFKLWYVLVPAAVLVAAGVVFVVVRKKNKKKAQELLGLDDDLAEELPDAEDGEGEN